jgi:predicted transcriptional regulator
MKVQDVMTRYPVCCCLTDTAQMVAEILRDEDIGSVPVICDGESQRLVGIITDLDPRTTLIDAYITRNLVTCRREQSLDSCEKLMQTHRVRRILIVDHDMRCIGILSEADIARSDESHKVHKTVAEISKPSQTLVTAPVAA